MKEQICLSFLAEHFLSWAVNAMVVVALPIRMGLSQTSLWLFLAYAVVCGTILTVADDRHFLIGIVTRRDVRGYLFARIAIVAVIGIVPFSLGRFFAG